ncbi:adenosylcobinamide-phosphate synthase CbiB, partial [Chloroflexota bacterium]
MDIVFILLLALAMDLVLGEPHRTIHPVVWMGKAVSFLERGGRGQSPVAQFLYGLVMVLVILALFIAPVYFILTYLKGLNFVGYLIAGAVLLKTTFSLKELRRAALKVRRLLQEDKLDEARFELRSLVSAAVESVAEGACDSFIAPLFYFLLFGVPGAIGYRVVNTMDAMVGYHGKYEYLGKFASRLDDMLNFIPARLTALLLVLAFMSRNNGRASWRVAVTGHSQTESPNAGWPIAAIAGALNVQL